MNLTHAVPYLLTVALLAGCGDSQAPLPPQTVAGTDFDADGWSDADEALCKSDPSDADDAPGDLDDDGLCDAVDDDRDNDEHANTADAFPDDPAEYLDTDGDGAGDNADLDDDGDGAPDAIDVAPLDPTDGANVSPVFTNLNGPVRCTPGAPVSFSIAAEDANHTQPAPSISLVTTCGGFTLSGSQASGVCPAERVCTLMVAASDGKLTTNGEVAFVPNNVFFVAPVTRGTGDGASWANASANPQALLNAWPGSLTLLLEQGTYAFGNPLTVAGSRAVTLEGGYAGTWAPAAGSYPTATVIDGGAAHRVLAVATTDATFTLRNVEIANGFTTDRGAGLDTVAPTVLENVVFFNNVVNAEAVAQGGAVYAAAPIFVTDATFVGNQLSLTGTFASVADGAAIYAAQDLRLHRVVAQDNRINLESWGEYTYNRGIVFRAERLEADQILVYENRDMHSTYNGATIEGMVYALGRAAVRNSRFERNDVECSGYPSQFCNLFGVALRLGIDTTLRGNIIHDNRGQVAGGYAYGGGVYLEGGEVAGNQFSLNSVDAPAVMGNGRDGASLYLENWTTSPILTVRHNTFVARPAPLAANFSVRASAGTAYRFYNNVSTGDTAYGPWGSGPAPVTNVAGCGTIGGANDTVDVVFAASNEAFLGAASECVDIGDEAAADEAYGDDLWHAYTNALDGATQLDDAGMNPVLPDAGVLFPGEAAWVNAFGADGAGAYWAVHGGAACRIQVRQKAGYLRIPADRLPNGSATAAELASIGWQSAAIADLYCLGTGDSAPTLISDWID